MVAEKQDYQTELIGLTKGDVKGWAADKDTTIPMKGMAYAEIDPGVRANMRAATRWDYVSEYIGYWIDNKRQLLLTVVFALVGVFLLGVFWPVGLLMIMLAGKYKNQSWWNKFVYGKFGKNRTLVLVD